MGLPEQYHPLSSVELAPHHRPFFLSTFGVISNIAEEKQKPLP
jgi:hypothetical protein